MFALPLYTPYIWYIIYNNFSSSKSIIYITSLQAPKVDVTPENTGRTELWNVGYYSTRFCMSPETTHQKPRLKPPFLRHFVA